jgi:hypothetical protein
VERTITKVRNIIPRTSRKDTVMSVTKEMKDIDIIADYYLNLWVKLCIHACSAKSSVHSLNEEYIQTVSLLICG